MALYETREYTTTTYEWSLPADCSDSDLNAVRAKALDTYLIVHGLDESNAPVDGSWIQSSVVDGRFVLRFEVQP
ncbi:hypothetical protein [Melissospora conviva]|uniref:hypothetical protein n=1 Tax=Melissospora conviva TaxID=3388432 RepID=UPI003C26783E